MPYKLLLKSFSKLLDASTFSTKISPARCAEAYTHYSKELISGYNHSSRYKKWDVCWIQWGNNLEPEMGYKHMGIIFKVDNKQVYAFPITTFNTSNHQIANAYHPIDNPLGNRMYYKIKSSDYNFLCHDSVIKLTELKAMSVKRVISKCGSIIAFTDIKNEITEYGLDYLFHEKYNEIKRINKENSLLKMKLELASIPKEIVSIDEIIIKSTNTYKIDKISDKKLNIILSDLYGQTESKTIVIKNTF